MKQIQGGADLPYRYERPFLVEYDFSPEAGFADSNGIDKISDWDEWE